MPVKGVPRAPHKDGCLCAVCKAMRAKLEAPPPADTMKVDRVVRIIPPPPIEVRLDSLAAKNKFRLRGEENLVKERIEGMVVCYNLFINDTVTLGGSTMVEPI